MKVANPNPELMFLLMERNYCPLHHRWAQQVQSAIKLVLTGSESEAQSWQLLPASWHPAGVVIRSLLVRGSSRHGAKFLLLCTLFTVPVSKHRGGWGGRLVDILDRSSYLHHGSPLLSTRSHPLGSFQQTHFTHMSLPRCPCHQYSNLSSFRSLSVWLNLQQLPIRPCFFSQSRPWIYCLKFCSQGGSFFFSETTRRMDITLSQSIQDS